MAEDIREEGNIYGVDFPSAQARLPNTANVRHAGLK
jgi:uncharacterized protein YuzE